MSPDPIRPERIIVACQSDGGADLFAVLVQPSQYSSADALSPELEDTEEYWEPLQRTACRVARENGYCGPYLCYSRGDAAFAALETLIEWDSVTPVRDVLPIDLRRVDLHMVHGRRLWDDDDTVILSVQQPGIAPYAGLRQVLQIPLNEGDQIDTLMAIDCVDLAEQIEWMSPYGWITTEDELLHPDSTRVFYPER